jgi:hypothetical protein
MEFSFIVEKYASSETPDVNDLKCSEKQLVSLLIPGLSQQRSQYIWSSPLSEGL